MFIFDDVSAFHMFHVALNKIDWMLVNMIKVSRLQYHIFVECPLKSREYQIGHLPTEFVYSSRGAGGTFS